MSYLHPTGETNSAGQNPDPLNQYRKDRANRNYDKWFARKPSIPDKSPFGSWKRVKEDIIHFTPIDSLPEEEQDAIRVRRQRQYQESDVPWILNDFAGLMSAFDDVDDLKKTGTLLKDYALTPAARLANRLRKGEKLFKDGKLGAWKEACGEDLAPRQRKLGLSNYTGLNALAQLATLGLGVLFPQWRLLSLLLQAAQTTDTLFGVGIQLGPILGYAEELFFRGLREVGGPVFDFENKFEQIKGARVIRNANRTLAAAPYGHPDDALTSLTGFYDATGHDVLPPLVIAPDDYPSLEQVYNDPWQIGKEAFDATRLAASLPYNLGALFANNLLADALGNESEALGGAGANGLPDPVPDNEQQVLMMLTEEGICPNGECEATIASQAMVLAAPNARYNPDTGYPISDRQLARNLRMHVDEPLPRALPPGAR